MEFSSTEWLEVTVGQGTGCHVTGVQELHLPGLAHWARSPHLIPRNQSSGWTNLCDSMSLDLGIGKWSNRIRLELEGAMSQGWGAFHCMYVYRGQRTRTARKHFPVTSASQPGVIWLWGTLGNVQRDVLLSQPGCFFWFLFVCFFFNLVGKHQGCC